jgi:hypothetical protein
MSLCDQGQARKPRNDALLLALYLKEKPPLGGLSRRGATAVVTSCGYRSRYLTHMQFPGSPDSCKISRGTCLGGIVNALSAGRDSPYMFVGHGTFGSRVRFHDHERTSNDQTDRAIGVGDIPCHADAQRNCLLNSLRSYGSGPRDLASQIRCRVGFRSES